jgi:N-acetylglucosaminyldiphosphoundecaprenol N-acetyl-beta-D-mannosaminyltransferase
MNRINILNTSVDNYSMKETLQFVEESIVLNKYIHHVGVNAEKIAIMQTDLQLREYVNHSDLINPDGIGVIWASKILGKPLKERVAGIDLMIKIVELAHKKDYKVFFLGAKEDVVKSVVDKYTKQYSSNIIAGYRNGYFKKEEEQGIAKVIANSGANILFVAISSPAKENFLYENKKLLEKVNFVMGVGGSFDVVSGKVKRAPLWMQNFGLEWFYRFTQEPRRMWKRYLTGNAKFILLVIKWKLFK